MSELPSMNPQLDAIDLSPEEVLVEGDGFLKEFREILLATPAAVEPAVRRYLGLQIPGAPINTPSYPTENATNNFYYSSTPTLRYGYVSFSYERICNHPEINPDQPLKPTSTKIQLLLGYTGDPKTPVNPDNTISFLSPDDYIIQPSVYVHGEQEVVPLKNSRRSASLIKDFLKTLRAESTLTPETTPQA